MKRESFENISWTGSERYAGSQREPDFAISQTRNRLKKSAFALRATTRQTSLAVRNHEPLKELKVACRDVAPKGAKSGRTRARTVDLRLVSRFVRGTEAGWGLGGNEENLTIHKGLGETAVLVGARCFAR